MNSKNVSENIRVRLRGKELVWMRDQHGAGPLAYPDHVGADGHITLAATFKDSYGHVYSNGEVKRYGLVMATVADLEILPPPATWAPCDECPDPMDCGSWKCCERWGSRTAASSEWIAVDLDGTLFTHHGWLAWNKFGEPIAPMVERVKKWLAEGKCVKIFTARVAGNMPNCLVTGEPVTVGMMTSAVQDHLEKHGLPRLECTATKDHLMVALWDDRAVQVIPNTGRTLAEEHETERERVLRAIELMAQNASVHSVLDAKQLLRQIAAKAGAATSRKDA